MRHSTQPSPQQLASPQMSVEAIRASIAWSLVGRTVDLVVSAGTIAHGVVTGVLTESGRPKVVVDRSEYDLSQILTVTPAAVN
jgi:hypothetical protein